MGYQWKPANDGAVLPVEQARQRNLELRRELATLAAENARLETKATAVRVHLSIERRKLTQKVRQLDATRAQAELIDAAKQVTSDLPEPVYGGREGLQAATDEMNAHEAKGLKLTKAPRPSAGLSHGTNRKYASGCRCDECKESESRRNAQRYMARRRKSREMEAA